MNKLLNLQNQFQDYLLNANSSFQNCIIHTDKVPAETRLAIYGNAYRSRLTEALTTNFPILYAYLGHDQFEELGKAYLSIHPSSFRSIRWFGNQLANFLSQHSFYQAFPLLAELAQFEWALTLVFDAADDAVLEIEDMATLPPDDWINMQLQMHPSVHRLSLSWNVVQIWQAISHDQAPPEPMLNAHSVSWIVWRKEFNTQFYSLEENEAWAIDAVFNKMTFSNLCEGLCQWTTEEEAPLLAASLLKKWISEGMIAKIIL